MAEKSAIWDLARANRADALVIVVTFLLVVFRDLTQGIVTGFALAGLVFIHRMSHSAVLDSEPESDIAHPNRVVLRLSGPYFFGAAAQLSATLDQAANRPVHFVLDLGALNYLDSSGARSLALLAHKVHRKGGQMVLVGVRPEQRGILEKAGLAAPFAIYLEDVAELDRLADCLAAEYLPNGIPWYTRPASSTDQNIFRIRKAALNCNCQDKGPVELSRLLEPDQGGNHVGPRTVDFFGV